MTVLTDCMCKLVVQTLIICRGGSQEALNNVCDVENNRLISGRLGRFILIALFTVERPLHEDTHGLYHDSLVV